MTTRITLSTWWIEHFVDGRWERVVDVHCPDASTAAQWWMETGTTRDFRVVRG
jgi:hypothetical protein